MNTEDRFDYIIVGAGSAGCTLAARLTESALNLSAQDDRSNLYGARLVAEGRQLWLPCVAAAGHVNATRIRVRAGGVGNY